MESSNYKFTCMQRRIPTLGNKDYKTYFEKWNLLDRLRVWTFSFDKQFHHYAKEKFVLDFMTDLTVLSTLQCMSSPGGWSPLVSKVRKVLVEEIPCTVLSMEFFDRLKEYNIVRESGHICKCFDEFYEGITISDELRKMILLEDSDNFECYNDDERAEFLFRLFTHICIGGPICQYEDGIEPYFNVVKSLYKDCISVQKNSGTKEIEVVSRVFKIKAQDDHTTIFPAADDNLQTFAYLVVEPVKRQVILIYHHWGKQFW